MGTSTHRRPQVQRPCSYDGICKDVHDPFNLRLSFLCLGHSIEHVLNIHVRDFVGGLIDVLHNRALLVDVGLGIVDTGSADASGMRLDMFDLEFDDFVVCDFDCVVIEALDLVKSFWLEDEVND